MLSIPVLQAAKSKRKAWAVRWLLLCFSSRGCLSLPRNAWAVQSPCDRTGAVQPELLPCTGRSEHTGINGSFSIQTSGLRTAIL